MFCYSSGGHSICCEGSGTARTDLDDDDGPANPLKYKPEDAERAKETLKVLQEIEQAVLTAKPEQSSTETSSTEADTTPTASTASDISDGPSPPGIRPSTSSDKSEGPSLSGTKHYADSDDEPALTSPPATETSKQYADNEGSFVTLQKPSTKRPKQRKVKDSEVTGPAKAQAVKLHPHEAGPPAATYDAIEYQPHALGGYAVSKKLHGTNLKAPRPEKKALVQQFLLDH